MIRYSQAGAIGQTCGLAGYWAMISQAAAGWKPPILWNFSDVCLSLPAVLRYLALSMDSMSLGEAPYYPNVVEVAGDRVKRSIVDLDVLYDGYIPNPVMAVGKIERW